MFLAILENIPIVLSNLFVGVWRCRAHANVPTFWKCYQFKGKYLESLDQRIPSPSKLIESIYLYDIFLKN